MNTKMKALFFGLFFVASISLRAQDKYEYIIISYSPYYQNITISMGRQKYDIIDIKDRNSGKFKERNFNAALDEVSKYQELGWELFNTQATGSGTDINSSPYYFFYMRRKK